MMSTEQSNRRKAVKRQVRRLGLILFTAYVSALVYFLFFADWFDHSVGAHWTYSYNYVPFQEIRRFGRLWRNRHTASAFLNLFGNVIGFLPFGFFLPVITRKLRNGPFVVLMAFCVSLGVELIQLVLKAGCCDVDDVILNTFGAAAGYWIFLLADRIRLNMEASNGG